jgi:hypothetical protein
VLRITGDEFDWLVRELESLKGERLVIHESISRSRDVGKHDRHFATSTRFELVLERIGAYFSGTQLCLEGEGDSQYGIALDSVVSVRREGEVLVVVEWFESETERRTTIRRQAAGAT